ncbi:MAG: carboxypeptidase-like regulatory domain-containing protein [Bacteroidota bacterium]
MRKIFLGIIAITLLTFSCRKNEDTNITTVSLPEPAELVNTEIQGTVITGAGEAITNAKVEFFQAERKVAEINTNTAGNYDLTAPLKANQPLILRASKEGFMSSTAKFTNSAANTTNLETRMMSSDMARSGSEPLEATEDLIVLSGKLIDNTSLPLSTIWVVVVTEDGKTSYGISDEAGEFSVTTLANVPLQLIIINRFCREINLDEPIGSFDTDQQLGDFQLAVSSLQTFEVSGQVVDCDGNPLSEASVQAIIGASRGSGRTDENGFYKLAVQSCSEEALNQVEISAWDSAFTASTSIQLGLSGNIVEAPTIELCPNTEENIESSIVLTIGDTTVELSATHNFQANQIFPLNNSQGLTIIFARDASGELAIDRLVIQYERLTITSGPGLNNGTAVTLDLTTYTDDAVDGSFTGEGIERVTGEVVPISGTFSIRK